MPIPYDPSRVALYSPEAGESVLRSGAKPSELQLAIEACRLAYYRYDERPSEEERLTQALATAGYGDVEWFLDVGTDGQAFGCSNETHALLAFRGTQPDAAGDLASDSNALLTPWSEGNRDAKVHAGFKRAAEGLWYDIAPWVEKQKQQKRRLTLCGHSLGAAIATLLCSRAEASALVTLGSPRVGNRYFADDVTAFLASEERTHHRIVNCCDVVARIPPESEDGYCHLGGEWTYIAGKVAEASDEKVKTRRSPSEDFVDEDRRSAALHYLHKHAFQRGTVLVRDLADHAPINYLRAFWP